MLLRCVLRSVGRRTCLLSVGDTMVGSNTGGFSMLPTFEERVFFPMGKKFISTLEHEKLDDTTKSLIIGNINEEYERAINQLNTLQSNADTLRRSIANNNKQTPLDDTFKFLDRSGLSLAELEKLSFIHVSGTKGKGSTCALTESILRAHGIKTAFFSSPHLVSATERIRINGEPISKHKFTRAFNRVFQRLEAAKEHESDMPAYFKFLTILCFHIILEEQVDVTILEVGIGGELDCTNIIGNVKTIGITSLGLEHTQLLGTTLEEIAWQKAGIIKPNANVYTSAVQPECLEVIKQRSAEKNANLYIVPEFNKYFPDAKSQAILKNLNYVAQLNGSMAVQLAYDWLRTNTNEYQQESAPNTNTHLTKTVLQGLVNCLWPGRCQVVKFLNFNIHLDGAHTVESMYVCSDWFDKIVANNNNPKVLIFNTTGDRDSTKLLDILRRKSEFAVACFVPNFSMAKSNRNDNQTAFGITEQTKRAQLHAGNWHMLCAEANTCDNSRVFGSIFDSFNYIQNRFGTKPQIDVLVTGSLHLIGATVLALNEFKQSLIET